MPSITTWTRLEPICREDDVRAGLEARVHDPLWLLGRQWQVSEFKGEDAGSPVGAKLRMEASSLTRWRPGALPAEGPAPGLRFDPAATPLETLVEREPAAARAAPSLRFAVDAGRHFLRLLRANGAAAQGPKFLASHAVEPPPAEQLAELDEETRRLYEVFAGRTIDGARLFRDFSRKFPTKGGLGSAARLWLAWYRTAFAEPEKDARAWIDERLEYRFAVSAPTPSGEVVLQAPEYTEGRLDWYDFSVARGASLGAKAAEASVEKVERTLIPAPVSYPGMPSERWWEFEDARIHFGAVDVQPGDLVTSVLLQFAIVYGNDWFVVPVRARVGALCEIRSLVVTDSFGVPTEVAPFTGPNWRMFSFTVGNDPSREVFFLPPVLAHASPGPTIEEVLFARDEAANLAWAIERQVESPGGGVIDRRSVEFEAPGDVSLPPGPELRYRLAAEPPAHWVPLVPTVDPASGRLRLHRTILKRPPLGRIAGTKPSLAVENEEIPKTGVVVTRSPQWTRWIDGSSHLWIGRRKLPGNGETSSGLRFDFLESAPP